LDLGKFKSRFRTAIEENKITPSFGFAFPKEEYDAYVASAN